MHLSTILSVAFAALALAHPNNVAKREARVTEENPPLEARAPQITESPAALLDADGLEERAAQVTEDDPPKANGVAARAPEITEGPELVNVDELAARAPQRTEEDPPITDA
ncbi:hypothetical protein HBI38_184270 [Parastagonospora nodorum]|nr:hypothetical protein HBI64_160850 [Parastagonospora nodorum]KAH6258376.1 hypothetical protein HBI41_152270 [Parastagonospora nodorum]KAH6284941.1 hypothetical protein HBI40_127520 [Parastagonospora nodorum]KAH6309089.1 hypothetical protein HBI38_184270 [Parastagonospora nodorum]